jgi:hypothetical protein
MVAAPTVRTLSRPDAPGTREDGRAAVLSLIPPRAICAEVGSWKGDFAARIMHSAAPAELHLIDPWRFDPSFPARWYGGFAAKSQADMDAICDCVRARFSTAPQVKLHRLPSVEGSRQFKDGVFDWVYIDGDHSEDAVRADLTAWYPKVKPGGQLVCDDYHWRDEAGRQSVKAAVDAFMAARASGGARGARQPGGQFIITAAGSEQVVEHPVL